MCVAIAMLTPHNVHGWTSGNVHDFVSNCESSGFVSTPSYCECVGKAVAANANYGTYQVQLSDNSVATVITHNELTQGGGC